MEMFNANQLCKKITTLYPEIGACGIDIDVTKDFSEKTSGRTLVKVYC